jgi:translation initiation factor IF-2
MESNANDCLNHTGELEKTLTGTDGDVDWDKLDLDYILGEKEKIKLVVKADVKGTLEAILQSLDHDSVDVLRCGVGQITEEDLELASGDKVLLIAFNLQVSNKTKKTAKNMGVKIKQYDIIYHLIEDLQKQMLKLMDATIDEVVTGEAEILEIFEMKGERIAGVRVKTGEIKQHDLLHLKRNDEIIANPVIKRMMHGKDEIKVVKIKNEAGLTFKNKKIDFQAGDLIIAYRQDDLL